MGLLIAATAALLAINQCGAPGEFRNTSDYRTAAIASIATSSMAIAFHVFMIILHCIYRFSTEEKFFRSYAFIVRNHIVNYINS